jgi:hypothetical protein
MRTSAVLAHSCKSLRDMRIAVAQVALTTKTQQLLLQSLTKAGAAILRTSEGLNVRKSRHVIARIEDAVFLMRS